MSDDTDTDTSAWEVANDDDLNFDKAPFPYWGGKSRAAPAVWAALGDPDHYVEPFAGTMAVLLNRKADHTRAYHSETVCDKDGLLVNAWRAIQRYPDETAEWAAWPVSEADLHARHLALLAWRREQQLEHLMADPEWCDPKMAGWWLWGISCWIGGGWCAGNHAWVRGPNDRVIRRKDYPEDALTDRADLDGVSRRIPHLSNNGRGVNHAAMRADLDGVDRQLPHLSNDGQGVNRQNMRADLDGVKRQRPQLGDNGRGVNRQVLRADLDGVKRQRPHLGDDGQGVNHAHMRADLDGDTWTPWVGGALSTPQLRYWFRHLANRLRWVRIVNGDWQRVATHGAVNTLSVRGGGIAGIFLDPPYADTARRDANLYAIESSTVAHDVRAWCLKNGENPQYRIVLAGFDGEHGTALVDAGWREVAWYTKGWLCGGMGNIGKGDGDAGTTSQQTRERLWCSPHCLTAESAAAKPVRQLSMFEAATTSDDR